MANKRGAVTPVDMAAGNKRRAVTPGGAQVLPEEMMIEVFLRLPVKSIIRFRAVCRSWADVLSSEEFCALHMAKTEAVAAPVKLFFTSPTATFNATRVYLGSSSNPDDGLLFTMDDVHGDFVDMTSSPCRGLTLLYDAVAPAYYVFNAATRAVTRLPPCEDVPFPTAGLGFDAQTNKYKVVRLFQGNYLDKQRIKCEVYTLGGEHGNCWRPAVGGVPFRFCRAADGAISHSIEDKLLPVFADGFLHWLLHPYTVVKRPRTAILSFSVIDETFRWVQSPPFMPPGVFFQEDNGQTLMIRERVVSGLHLVELAGHLCMLRDLRNASYDCSVLEIWRLKDYNSGGWSLDHRIDLLAHAATDLIKPRIVKVIGSVGDCVAKKVVIATSERKVIIYDTALETLETILEVRETHSYHTEQSALRVSLFKETLVPVHQTNEEIALSAPLAKVTREILLRLPASYIVQLKLVCKHWLRLIQKESFTCSYYSHNNMNRKPKIMLVGKGIGGSDFSFTPLKKLLRHTPNHIAWLDRKVVCSKPCHGMNLLSTTTKDYIYNPSTGYCYANQTRGPSCHVPWIIPRSSCTPEDHTFAVGNKIVGLGFNLLKQEHVSVEIFYHWKDFESRQYFLTCSIFTRSDGSFENNLLPPLPVNHMPPTYLSGVLYWMSEPRLGQSSERAIVSFDIARNMFNVIPCPSCVAFCNNGSSCQAFVVDLMEMLCVVLSDPVAEQLDIWKLQQDRWDKAFTLYMKGWPGYSLRANVVVPWAVYPKDGRILLNTGRKLGLYDTARHCIESLYDLDDDVLRIRSEQSSYTEFMPLVPILYEESLTSYPRWRKARFLQR